MADPASSKPNLLRFGAYVADLRSGELMKGGVRLKLSGQPFQVLVMLLQRPGEVVTREEMQQALWPADTFVDFDHSLNTAINKVRAVLGDSGTNPRFVETLARRGYRFIAPVIAEGAGPEKAHLSPASLPVGPSEGAAQAARPTPLQHELPRPSRVLVRGLFALAQILYLILYVVALWHLGGVERESGRFAPTLAFALAVATLVLATLGIPVRFYLLFATAFDYRHFAGKFRKMFPALLILDLLWALTPFLLAERIGLGLAFAATAALLYLPFGERTLVRMGYEGI